MKEKKIINDRIKRMELEEFLAKTFARAGYSRCHIQPTALATRIIIFAQKPGIIIGRSGKTVDMLTETIKNKFGIENPQLEIEEVENPFLDAQIVANYISSAIERGLNYKRVAHMVLENTMDAGAVGIAIKIGGKIGGAMARVEKFSAGYMKWSGDPAHTLVQKAYARAQVKLGTIGIQVRILTKLPEAVDINEKEGIKKAIG